jgi:hypothetical protein
MITFVAEYEAVADVIYWSVPFHSVCSRLCNITSASVRTSGSVAITCSNNGLNCGHGT